MTSPIPSATHCVFYTPYKFWFWQAMLDYYKGETEPWNPVSFYYVGLQNHNYNLGAPKDLGTLYHNIKNTHRIEKPCIKPKHRLSHRGRLWHPLSLSSFSWFSPYAQLLNLHLLWSTMRSETQVLQENKLIKWSILLPHNSKQKTSFFLKHSSISTTKSLILRF